ncbi:DUF599 domain-containing protein [Roseateles albus]|uniref:DUF599 domain-containing protein n=1 Tax=Roseateles albus TaxID=2987525 RepID=A0ABT5KB31_9BURK|nr:DUF599 domain-containing protein [Roseateles albus]MDC8771148.1 DUF599 domain-containing protein [Roseateles albus]
MNEMLKALAFLPLADWLALIGFFIAWMGYVSFASRRSQFDGSLLAATNRERWRWMYQATFREVRVIDGVVVQNLSTSPSFFASTTILIIGGLLAMLGAGEKASAMVADLPFAARTSELVFEFKLVLLTAIFVYAFFRFTWSMRQYTFGALLVGAAPDCLIFERGEASREDFADRAGRVMGLAAETFNDGLRSYYLSFAVVAWFFSPWAFMCSTAGVIFILYQREFRSEILEVLRSGAGGSA